MYLKRRSSNHAAIATTATNANCQSTALNFYWYFTAISLLRTPSIDKKMEVQPPSETFIEYVFYQNNA